MPASPNHERRRPGRRSKAAGLLAICAVMLLAHGVPGIADAPPSQQYADDRISERLSADARTELLTDEGQELPPALIRTIIREGGRGRKQPGPYVRDYRRVALREARRAGIRHPKLFVRQMAAESGFQPCARSYAGALGIAQIMPSTARSWNVDPHVPEAALRVAAQHMARYERAYGNYRMAAAAYNAGPGAVNVYGGVPPYPETREYVRRITDRSYPLAGMRQVFHLPGGMQTGFARRLRALKSDVRRHGGRIRVVEGWRSYQDQLRIWRYTRAKYGFEGARRWAAPPGCSNHGRGWAADLVGSVALAHQLAPRHGLTFPMSHEPWHVELRGIATQSGT